MKKKILAKSFFMILTIMLVQMIYGINYAVMGEGEEPTKVTLTENNITINTLSTYQYTGAQIKPGITIIYQNTKLIENIDYKLTYQNNVNVGNATVIIEGQGNYTGTIKKNYKIVKQNLKNIKVQVNTKNYKYTGESVKATVKIYNNKIKLQVNKDYTLTYKNTVNTGKAKVTIKGIGNYTGTITKTYKIVPKKAKIKNVIMNKKNTKATITWKEDKQASGYVIYRATSKNGEYTKIKNVKNNKTTQYVAKNLNSKKTYYFKIRAYKTIDGKKAYSNSYSDPKTNTGLLAKITLISTSSSKNRNTNLKVASKAINGTVLKPGQTFNWFKVVGPATVSKGYKSATVFVDKKPVPGVGGGICQVSTTLYQAAKKAGLKIVERHTHSLPVTYTTKGKDATVAYGVKNLRIKNNKKYSIKIVAKTDKNKTICEIYKVND